MEKLEGDCRKGYWKEAEKVKEKPTDRECGLETEYTRKLERRSGE